MRAYPISRLPYKGICFNRTGEVICYSLAKPRLVPPRTVWLLESRPASQPMHFFARGGQTDGTRYLGLATRNSESVNGVSGGEEGGADGEPEGVRDLRLDSAPYDLPVPV